ncbi:MAG: hypothetical protein OER77_03090 [Myxococcales bacterium]|nr:hypothetical protein [Myxococcales bacterium]
MAYRWLGPLLFSAACACVFGCAAETGLDPRGGSGGESGAGGSGGIGGTAGSGGVAGFGGTGGTGGTPQTLCVTSALCETCPTERLCDTDVDCVTGGTCIESGCATEQGAPIKQCAYAIGGACETTLDCGAGRECIELPGEGQRCVRTAPGCSAESHCFEGFDCENFVCVDRRVPCEFDSDCPKNYVCQDAANDGQQCVRVHQPCDQEIDCAGIAPRCADVDGDGRTECAGVDDPNVPGDACFNADCALADLNAPVCEISGIGAATVCGDYGLCRSDGDCDTGEGFVCVALGLDGRKECAPTGGTCSSSTTCPTQQVCASPRVGGPPSCQAGKEEL